LPHRLLVGLGGIDIRSACLLKRTWAGRKGVACEASVTYGFMIRIQEANDNDV
jgi:hypothetical protein